MLRSGIHATIAGILVAFIIPASRYIDTKEFLGRARQDLLELENAGYAGTQPVTRTARAAFLHLQMQSHLVEAPLLRLERALQPWVSFFIMPQFGWVESAKANCSTLRSMEFSWDSSWANLRASCSSPGLRCNWVSPTCRKA
jgi:NhaA family Na+:H+ antiporter